MKKSSASSPSSSAVREELGYTSIVPSKLASASGAEGNTRDILSSHFPVLLQQSYR